MDILSYGGGVQSFTILCLIADGKLNPPHMIAYSDMSPFEDETLEFTRTHGQYMAAQFGRQITILQPEKTLEMELMRGQVVTPFWYADAVTGKPQLQSRRSCTTKYKVIVVNALIKRYAWDRIWLGISADELRRVRDDDEKLTRGRMRTNRYPLIELDMTRTDCLTYLNEHGYPVPERSSCDMCPFSSSVRILRNLAKNTGTYERIKRIEAAWHKRPKNTHKYLTRYLENLPTPEQAVHILAALDSRAIDNSGTCGVCEF